MNYYGAEYYIYKIIHGIPFDVRKCPDRDYSKGIAEISNIDSENISVCLNCTKKKCTGTKRCYEQRLDALLHRKDSDAGNKDSRECDDERR